MTPEQFVGKWSGIVLKAKEIAISQSHFNDVCALVGHLTPSEYDPEQTTFVFEKSAEVTQRADVFFRHKFIWEYKRPDGDLNKAHQQLLRYSKVLEEPPLLITSDTRKIILHTNSNNENFRGYVHESIEITFDDILAGHGLETLKRAFFDPFSFRPKMTRAEVTQATAESFVSITDTMKRIGKTSPERLAHFFARIFFVLFAEDAGLLPQRLMQQAVSYNREYGDPITFRRALQTLFRTMKNGEMYGYQLVRHFNGKLFDDDFVPELDEGVMDKLAAVAEQNWSQVDPTIFGQLFERVIDEEKRSQLGAHYTSEEDITLVVEPVLMQPLREEWATIQREVGRFVRKGDREQAFDLLSQQAQKIASVTVLDPACGSGNFLYLSLQKLLDLQRDVIVFADRHGLPKIELTVHPGQLFGIEKNHYAYELAQIVIWVGYLQWRIGNGFGDIREPILPALTQIECKDAILGYDDEGNPLEPLWPSADVIIGNPPFLGRHKLRHELTDEYVTDLLKLYKDRVPYVDLVVYWFEMARAALEQKPSMRIGLIATNSIRGGANQEVLKRIKVTGNIFNAWSDRKWIIEGANVRVSIVCFDGGKEGKKFLNGNRVDKITADLTASVDVISALRLRENSFLSFIGAQKNGPFDLSAKSAQEMMTQSNPSGVENKDVLRPILNSRDIVQLSRQMWVIDFDQMPEEVAKKYVAPYNHVKNHVKPTRDNLRQRSRKENWWLYGANASGMRQALNTFSKFIVTPRVAKDRVFVWVDTATLADSAVVAIARDDDYFFGVLHSRIHEVWSLRLGSSLIDRPRYTPTTTFETFPFPYPPNAEPDHATTPAIQEIAELAKALNELREGWLHPDPMTFNGGVGNRYQDVIKKRTLTNLYNALESYRADFVALSYVEQGRKWAKLYGKLIPFEIITDLHALHRDLDQAVLEGYGWSADLTDDQILQQLLALNAERAAQRGVIDDSAEADDDDV